MMMKPYKGLGLKRNERDLTQSDKAYWVEKIYTKYNGNGHTSQESLELAAKYLNVTPQTAQNYFTLVALPESLKEMVDKSVLSQAFATQLVRNTYNKMHLEESEEEMKKRADWYLKLQDTERKYASKALNELKHGATIEQLTSYVADKMSQENQKVEFTIPERLKNNFYKWGEQQGLDDTQSILSHMVSETLKSFKP